MGIGLRRNRRLWFWVGGAVFLALASEPVAWELYQRWDAGRRLDAVIAELDTSDPCWRLEDVEADRTVVPPQENSARIVAAAYALLPKPWKAEGCDLLDKTPPMIALRAEDVKKLADELKNAHAALTKVRELENLRFGRYRLEYTPDFISSLVEDQAKVRPIAGLLHMDSCAAVQRGDMVQAWHSNRALLNAGRSLGDEPLLISMLIRIAVDGIAIHGLERALAHGELAVESLRERQQALDEERRAPLFLIGIRGERAGNNHLLSNIEAGKVSLLHLSTGQSNRDRLRSWSDAFHEFFAHSLVLRSHATMLDFETRMVNAARLPADRRYTALADIGAAIRDEIDPSDRREVMAQLFLPVVLKVADAEQRVHTHLACAVAGLAAERYRLRAGKWPASFDDLVQSGLLPEVPKDLFDGKPLRLRHAKDGLVIYGLGKDGTYDGTALDVPDAFDPSIVRVEFRLLDPARRRQPPLPVGEAKE